MQKPLSSRSPPMALSLIRRMFHAEQPALVLQYSMRNILMKMMVAEPAELWAPVDWRGVAALTMGEVHDDQLNRSKRPVFRSRFAESGDCLDKI